MLTEDRILVKRGHGFHEPKWSIMTMGSKKTDIGYKHKKKTSKFFSLVTNDEN